MCVQYSIYHDIQYLALHSGRNQCPLERVCLDRLRQNGLSSCPFICR